MTATKSIYNRFRGFSQRLDDPVVVPSLLLIVAVVSYALLFTRLGYYWDDFPLSYIKNIFGSQGLTRYFSTNRPFWGLLYQVTFSIFSQPWQWQLNALLWRWLSSVFVWLLIKETWPEQKDVAVWASLLFLVYPGFKQQHISIIYSNLFIILDAYLLSMYLSIKAVKQSNVTKKFSHLFVLTILPLILSLYQLLALEYFFALELLRPLFMWFALNGQNLGRQKKVRKLLITWLPYLVIWIGVVLWRAFFFRYQTHNYQLLFFNSLQESPGNAILSMVIEVGRSLWVVIVAAWIKAFNFPEISVLGMRTTLATALIIVAIIGMSSSFFLLKRNHTSAREKMGVLLAIGIIACLLGGIPWWLTELPPALRFPSDRFTLPFMLGVSLFIAGLISFIPSKGWIKSLVLCVLVGFAAGSQFQTASEFRRDWETQRRFFWQLAWRVPALNDGTVLMVNELPVTFYSDNSLTAPLNWFWAPENHSQQMSYLLLYPSRRLGYSLKSLTPGTNISVDYLAASFTGTTSQAVSVFYDPPACLRILDRALDSDNRMLPMEMQVAAALSSTQWILPENITAEEILPKHLYSNEPAHQWCYFYERADLARQVENWQKVAALGDEAYQLHDYPNDPSEHIPFIEGYAHTGNWARASELTMQSASVTPLMQPLLCRLWQRINVNVESSRQKDAAITAIKAQLKCME